MGEGKLVYGTGDATTATVRLRLADTENPYRPISRLVWPQRTDISGGDEEDQGGDVFIRRWTQARWDKGELKGLWEPGGYRQSTNVKPDRVGDRLEIGAFREVTDHDGAAAFSEGIKFVRGHGLLWATDDATAHWWQLATDDWDQTGWATGATTQTIVSGTDFGDGLALVIAYDDESIRKVATGANSSLWQASAGATYNSEVRYHQGVCYMLDGADLYSLDTTTTDTRTVLSQPGGFVGYYMASAGNLYRRMCVTDVGVSWLVPEDNGTTTIWEYNAKTQTDYPTGKLPVEFAFPYSIHYAHGYIFVGFRYAAAHGEVGDAHIYYQRGGQWGTAGPVRLHDSSSASQPVLIGGVIGDDLIFYYAGAVWAYDLSAGALFQVGVSGAADATTVKDCATYGKDIFLSNTDGSAAVERFDTTIYSTDTCTWKSGRFDFDLPGIKKAMLRVTVVTDPLPASTSMTLKVAADGGTFTTVTGTNDVDDVTTYTWTVSKSGGTSAQTTGYDFEIELGFATTASSSSPKVREVFCEAISAQKRRGVELDLDTGSAGLGQGASGTQLLSQLKAASEYSGGVISFVNPWSVAPTETAVTKDVLVEVIGGMRDQGVTTIRCWETSLV